MNDRITSSVCMGKVFVDEKGELYFIKETRTYPYILTNQNGEHVYALQPLKVEQSHIKPEEIGFSKSAEMNIFIYEDVKENLENKRIYYSMLLTFKIPDEKRFKTVYLSKTKSERVFLTSFDYGATSEISVNDPEICTRGPPVKCKPDTILRKDAFIFTLNGNGELERRVEMNDSAYGF